MSLMVQVNTQKLVELRKIRKLTQGRAASGIGISRTHLIGIEGGEPCSLKVALQIARFYGIPVESIFILARVVSDDKLAG